LEDFFETWKICENCMRLLQMGGTMWYIFFTSLNQCLERWDDWLWLVWSTKKVQHGGLCKLPETRTLKTMCLKQCQDGFTSAPAFPPGLHLFQ
jgi:hypothetical protein